MGAKPRIVKGRIQRAILDFYDQYKRDLPWRKTNDAYAIWVSEIMLQQTRVDTVIPYWQRWLAQFPTLVSLANADEDRVLSMWSGLGYYSRARNLQKGAQDVVDRYKGALPNTAEELKTIPGIGPYTAGAISSIAFNQPAAIVDGNVERVLCRLYGIASNPRETPTKKEIWRLAGELAQCDRPGDLNQGMMELGATVCAPKSPSCHRCPLEKICIAHKNGLEERLPALPKRKKTSELPKIEVAAALIQQKNGHIALTQRPAGGLYEHLWEFPNASNKKALASQFQNILKVGAKVATHGQTLSHRRLRLTLYECSMTGRLPPTLEKCPLRWFSREQMTNVGISTATTKLLEKIKQ